MLLGAGAYFAGSHLISGVSIFLFGK